MLPGNHSVGELTGLFLGQESGNNSSAPVSPTGAVGPGQLEPDTFREFARAGERIDNPADNRAVAQRAIQSYYDRFGGDVDRVAVAYFSGPRNVAPAGSAKPWKEDRPSPTGRPGQGKLTSSYVADIRQRAGGRLFDDLGGPTGDDYVRTLQAAPSWITSPNADALWLVDHYGRIVRLSNGQPFAVAFNQPAMAAEAPPQHYGAAYR